MVKRDRSDDVTRLERSASAQQSSTRLQDAIVDEAALALLARRSDARHEVREEVGRGGMGAVFRLYDRVLCRDVAMKSTKIAAGDACVQALTDEAQISAQLDHPYIVPVHDLGFGPRGDEVYFTMKLVRGETFAHVLEIVHGEPWDDRAIEGCLQVILKVCDALAFGHSRGVIHRDVKPENVMVGTYGQIYLMDWGLAALRPRDVERPGDDAPVTLSSTERPDSAVYIAGTPEYMAPEQLLGQVDRIDHRTDVFGVGGLLYCLLTARGPNAARTLDPKRTKPDAIIPPNERGAWPRLPAELCRITMKALARDPADRHQSVAELSEELQEFLRGGGWFETRTYPAGSVIVRQDEAATEAYMIVAGECDVRQTAGGQTSHLRRMGPGDVFGELALLTESTRTATVVAATDVTVKIVTAEDFERELDARSWAGKFMRAVAERFRDVDAQWADLRGRSSKIGPGDDAS